jgi:hypothetical protein
MAYHSRTREATRKILEMIDEGTMDPEFLARACLNYMSEADVADMAESEGFFPEEEEDDEGEPTEYEPEWLPIR